MNTNNLVFPAHKPQNCFMKFQILVKTTETPLEVWNLACDTRNSHLWPPQKINRKKNRHVQSPKPTKNNLFQYTLNFNVVRFMASKTRLSWEGHSATPDAINKCPPDAPEQWARKLDTFDKLEIFGYLKRFRRVQDQQLKAKDCLGCGKLTVAFLFFGAHDQVWHPHPQGMTMLEEIQGWHLYERYPHKGYDVKKVFVNTFPRS